MKKKLLILLILASCSKEKIKTETVNNEIKTHCKMVRSEVLDVATGQPTSWAIWYYNNDRLDSLVQFNPKRFYKSWYEYSTSTLRKRYSLDLSSFLDGSYTMETLNEKGEVLESKYYDKDGKLASWQKINYICD